jgi:hypothetical protein
MDEWCQSQGHRIPNCTLIRIRQTNSNSTVTDIDAIVGCTQAERTYTRTQGENQRLDGWVDDVDAT